MKAAIREWLIEQKAKPCMDCGVSYPPHVMDLNHREDEEKLYQPTRLWVMQSWKKAGEEVAKCDVVCANHHRERTHQQMSGNEWWKRGRGNRNLRDRLSLPGYGSACWARTSDPLINSQLLYQLS